MLSNFIFGQQTPVNRLVKYKADYDPDIIKDWTNMMSGISRSHQLWDKVAGKLGFRTRKDKDLEAKVKSLEEYVQILRNSYSNQGTAKTSTTEGPDQKQEGVGQGQKESEGKKRATDFWTAAGQGLGKPTKRCIAKEAPSLTDVPLGLEGETDQRVHR